jgi:hypothetical protein
MEAPRVSALYPAVFAFATTVRKYLPTAGEPKALDVPVPWLYWSVESEASSCQWAGPATFATLASPPPEGLTIEAIVRTRPDVDEVEKAFRHVREAILSPDSGSSELLRGLWQELEKMPLFFWHYNPQGRNPGGSVVKVRLEVVDEQFLVALETAAAQTDVGNATAGLKKAKLLSKDDQHILRFLLEKDRCWQKQEDIAQAVGDAKHASVSRKTIGTRLNALMKCRLVRRNGIRGGYCLTSVGENRARSLPANIAVSDAQRTR